MKKIDLKSLIIVEVVILFGIGLFSLDSRSKNYNEFNGICTQTWPKDAKQLQICLQPYYREVATDKYAIGVAIGLLIIAPVYYLATKKRT